MLRSNRIIECCLGWFPLLPKIGHFTAPDTALYLPGAPFLLALFLTLGGLVLFASRPTLTSQTGTSPH